MEDMTVADNLNLTGNQTLQNGVFAHIFHVEKECYVYDVVSSNIFKVSSFMGKILKILAKESRTSRKKGITALAKIHPGEKILEGLNKIRSYQKNNIFCPIPNDLEIRIDTNRNENKSLTPDLRTLVLEITQDCNFRCTYCPGSGNYYTQPRKHLNVKMSKETAFRSIDFFLKNTNYPNPEISFYGGEALLQKRLIRECMEYARNIKNGVTFRIQTNGFLLDEKFFKVIKDFDVNVDISIDGPKEIHDTNRLLPSGNGTFDKINMNLLRLGQGDLDYMIRKFSIAVTLPSTKNVDEIVNFFSKHPVLKNLRVRTNSLSLIGIKDKIKRTIDGLSSSTDLDRAEDRYIKMYSENEWQYLNVEHALFYPTLRLIIKRRPLKSPFYLKRVCPIGNWKLFVDVNGNFRACERGYILPIIGNVKEGFCINKIIEMENDFLSTSKPCYKCWALVMCNTCWVDIYKNPDLVDQKTKDQICKQKRKRLTKGLKLYTRITKENPKWFDLVPVDKRK